MPHDREITQPTRSGLPGRKRDVSRMSDDAIDTLAEQLMYDDPDDAFGLQRAELAYEREIESQQP
jgi:hypothetical protein